MPQNGQISRCEIASIASAILKLFRGRKQDLGDFVVSLESINERLEAINERIGADNIKFELDSFKPKQREEIVAVFTTLREEIGKLSHTLGRLWIEEEDESLVAIGTKNVIHVG